MPASSVPTGAGGVGLQVGFRGGHVILKADSTADLPGLPSPAVRALIRRWQDVILTVLLTAAAVAQLAVQDHRPVWRWLPPALLTTLPLLLRRRRPLRALLLGAAGGGLLAQPPALGSYAGYLVMIYSVGRYTERWRAVALTVMVCFSIALQVAVPTAGPPLPRQTLGPLIAVALFIAGTAIRSRRHELELMAAGRQQALDAALNEERSRIARELHDVVAHAVSLMTIQAGAARRQLNKDPGAAEAALKTVEASGRDALAELRRMLSVLAAQEVPAELTPQPGLDQLPQLVERVGQTGQPVELTYEGRPRPLSPGVELAAYRIAQEALTNAVRHARGAATHVLVGYGEHDLILEITTQATEGTDPAPGAGRGLVGMRERAEMYGGRLAAARRPDGSFEVNAHLPVDGQ